MANEPPKGSKPFPSAKSGASDDDIFAEMGRMLAQDQLGVPPAKSSPVKPATAAPPAKPAPAATGEDPPLDLTQVVKPGKPQTSQPAAAPPAAASTSVAPASAAPASATPASAAPIAARPASPPPSPAAAPSQGTKIGEAAAMLDGAPKTTAGITVSDRSLDSLVEDMVRPMIQGWIDQNMERIVREEVAKAVAKAAPNT